LFLGMRSHILDNFLHLITFSYDPSDMSKNLWQAWWGWFICFIVTIIVSFYTKGKSDEELVGLVKGLTETSTLEKPPLHKSPYLWAGISLLIFIFLNIYFW